MVGFCHRHIPTIFITDKFPPWWVFVMVGICRQAMMMMMMMMMMMIIYYMIFCDIFEILSERLDLQTDLIVNTYIGSMMMMRMIYFMIFCDIFEIPSWAIISANRIIGSVHMMIVDTLHQIRSYDDGKFVNLSWIHGIISMIRWVMGYANRFD